MSTECGWPDLGGLGGLGYPLMSGWAKNEMEKAPWGFVRNEARMTALRQCLRQETGRAPLKLGFLPHPDSLQARALAAYMNTYTHE